MSARPPEAPAEEEPRLIVRSRFFAPRSLSGEYILSCDVPKRKKRKNKMLNVVAKWSDEKQARMNKGPAWEAPVSPFNLIQEHLYRDPWKLLIACMLLNRTGGIQVTPKVIWDFFELCPTPYKALEVKVGEIEKVIRTLGLQYKRSAAIQEFTRQYLYTDWENVRDLYGIGDYAADAYAIFWEGRWREVNPSDHKLQDYWTWLHEREGEAVVPLASTSTSSD